MVIKENYRNLLLIDMLCIIRNSYYFIPLQSAKKVSIPRNMSFFGTDLKYQLF